MDLLIICGSRREPSRTRSLLRYAEERAIERGLDPTFLDLREHEMALFDGRDPDEYDATTREAVDQFVAADAYLIGSPVYFSGYSGALKNLFDHTPYQEYTEKRRAAGLVVDGRDARHQLVLDAQLRPLLVYLGVDVATDGVFATEADFGGDGFDLESEEVERRLDVLVDDTVELWEVHR